MSARAKPKPATDPLVPVAELAAELREAELVTARARARLEQAVRLASPAHTQLEIGVAAGLSRQRVSQILARRGAS